VHFAVSVRLQFLPPQRVAREREITEWTLRSDQNWVSLLGSESMEKQYDFLVVGVGFAGSVVSERLASVGKRVLAIDKRPHVGGNAYDQYDGHGVLIHPYGPHIFHTNSCRIIEYLSAFTQWRFYEHRSYSMIEGNLYPMPINRDTINRLYGLDLSEEGVSAYFERVREPRDPIETSEDVVLNSVGRDLYEKFYLNYIRKHWGLEPSQLSASVAARIPVRTNTDDRYFEDVYQFMPVAGYTQMFHKMLDHPNVTLQLGVDFNDVRGRVDASHVVYTGPIDSYFDCCYGKLPYRSVRFEFEYVDGVEFFQPVGQVNFPNEHAFKRITEIKRMTGQRHRGTTILREYPVDDGDPFYPIPTPENEALYKSYVVRAKSESRVTFVGRLAQYRYYNMDQVVGAALKTAENLIARFN
jgi:UDP-galactopyranose mutase